MKKAPLACLAVLALFSVSCSTVSYSQRHLDSSVKSIEAITFDDKITLDNIKVLGSLKATATVRYTVKPNYELIEGDGFKLETVQGKLMPEKGSTFKAGSLVRVNTVSDYSAPNSKGAWGGLFGGAPKPASASLNPRDLVMQAANYDLILSCSELGGDAVWMPNYVWQIEGDAMDTRNPVFTQTSGTTTYTVTVTAKAVSIQAADKAQK